MAAGGGRSGPVGGSSGTYMVRLSAHGGDGGDQLMTQNGIGVGSLNDQGWFNRIVVNVAATRETAIDTAAISAEYSRGGVHVNIVPKDGGNKNEGTLYFAFANSSMQSNNITKELQARGLPTQGKVKKTSDFNPATLMSAARVARAFGVGGSAGSSSNGSPVAMACSPGFCAGSASRRPATS